MATQEIPLGACVLSALGGALLLLEGSLLIVGSAVISSGVGPSPLGGVISGIGGLDAFEGLLIILLAFALLFNPRSHTGLGITILTLALLSLLTGGGFFLGAVFGYVGGVLGIVFAPRAVGPPMRRETPEEEFDDPVEEADLIDSGVLAPPKEEGPPAIETVG